jgi:cytochrome bd-type quinol oxidase subunit 2
VAFATAAVWLRFRTRGASAAHFADITERGLVWALLLTAAFIAVLSPANVRAERFIFPTYFVIGAIGVVTAMRNSDGMRRLTERADRPWIPIAVWMTTFLLSLGSRVLKV